MLINFDKAFNIENHGYKIGNGWKPLGVYGFCVGVKQVVSS
jgi:hypothetical protein